MFKVAVAPLDACFAFDLIRAADLPKFAALVTALAPGLPGYLHAGTPKGRPGWRFIMTGDGPTTWPRGANGRALGWPCKGITSLSMCGTPRCRSRLAADWARRGGVRGTSALSA